MTDAMARFGEEPHWSCPVCKARHYMCVVLTRNREEYKTQFHMCLGCSVVFIEPALFAAAPSVQQRFPPLQTKMAHEVSNERLAIERRFWEERSRRLGGGFTSEEQITALYRRGRLG